MSEDISKRSKLKIDTKEKHDLRGIATTPTESFGIVKNVLVNFAPRCTIYADFAVVKYPKPMLILPNTLLDKYNYDLLASKWELRLEYNGKEFFISINMHKVKNKLEVNCTNITPECDNFSTLDYILQNSQDSQNSQDFGGNDTLKKNMSYENVVIHIKKLEKKLSNAIKFNVKINEFCESLFRG